MAPAPENRQRIKALFQAALELNPSARASFLKHACAGDGSLQQEIESLLVAHEEAGGLAGSSLRKGTAGSGASPAHEIIGQAIGHYRIISFLGHGGMGEVYLAQDTHLARKVALKLLSESFSRDDDRLRRFQREARSASALNHPNVCVIHEVGSTDDGRPFIAMEHIEGTTVRQGLASGPLTAASAVDIAVQAAAALAAAHDAGVVHRDIKPENIMVRHDGYVKVLDFGLAKLTDRYNVASDSEAHTFPAFTTHSGLIMGTAHYMSPEQARRQQVDERSDIWSLGVVLYEMLTGCLPFTGETPSHVVVSILEREPRPLRDYLDQASAELEWIVKKALRKNPEKRYQTIKELLGDLEDIKHRVKPGLDASQVTAALKRPPLQSHSSAFRSISETLRRPRVSIGTLTLATLLVGLGFWYVLQLVGTKSSTPFQVMRLSKLTNTGKSINAAFSPDGKYFAHVVAEGGQQSIVLSDIAAGSNLAITQPSDVRYAGLTFSGDGRHIYYVRNEKNGIGQLYVVPSISGTSKRILSEVDSPVALSPDGKQFAFVRFLKNTGEYLLLVAQADGSGERLLTSRKNGDLFSLEGLSWSPDGTAIACAAGSYAGGFHMNVTEVRVADGAEKLLAKRSWFSIPQAVWLSDRGGLIVSAAEDSMSPYQIWYVSYPAGEVQRITNDANDYAGISLTADSKNLLAIQSSRLAAIWLAPDGDAERAIQITSGVGSSYGLALTPDGQVIYSSMASGKLDLWRIHRDGGERTQLTLDSGANYHPTVSRDGRYIFFASNRRGTFNVWRMDIDGNSPKQLSSGGSDFNPYPSPDGRWVIYQSGGGGGSKPTLWKVSVDGGQAGQLTNSNTSVPVVSPDGKQIACRYWDEAGKSQKIAIFPFDGGMPTKILDLPIRDWQRIRWTPDSTALTYVDVTAGVSNLWQQTIEGGPPKQLTAFKSDQIFSYEWSSDRKQLVCERGVDTNDVVLISSRK